MNYIVTFVGISDDTAFLIDCRAETAELAQRRALELAKNGKRDVEIYQRVAEVETQSKLYWR